MAYGRVTLGPGNSEQRKKRLAGRITPNMMETNRHGKVALRLSTILTEEGDRGTSMFRIPGQASDVRQTGATPLVLVLDLDAAIRSMDAAREAGVDRYIMVSYLGAGLRHGVPEDDPFFPYAEARAAADAYLRKTKLDWTILGPGRLTLEEPSGRIAVGPDIAEAIGSKKGVEG